jgi:hypothetical protein
MNPFIGKKMSFGCRKLRIGILFIGLSTTILEQSAKKWYRKELREKFAVLPNLCIVKDRSCEDSQEYTRTMRQRLGRRIIIEQCIKIGAYI